MTDQVVPKLLSTSPLNCKKQTIVAIETKLSFDV